VNGIRHGIARMVLPVARRAGRAYIAGPELQDALAVAERLAIHAHPSTIAFWDEVGACPDQVLATYVASIRALRQTNLDCYLSIKAPSLKFNRSAICHLVSECEQADVRLHFDSLGIETTDRTLALISESLLRFRKVTFTLPARWPRSLRDAEWAIEHGAGVRVVKGQWPDPRDGVVDPAAGFLRVIDKLAGRASHVAVASHNPKLAKAALEKLIAAGTPCELELLFGLPVDPVLRAVRQLGVRIRIYIPYGYGWLPYSLSQAAHSPRIFWWMLKDMMLRNSKSEIYSVQPNGH